MRTTVYENYRDNRDFREKFYQFTLTVFPGLDFKKWYEKGYWSDHYVPYSIIDENRIVSNVSISRMDLIIDGEKFRGIQMGTVGTIAGYRNRGLSRYLMDYVIDKYDPISDVMFLFANETVLDFYPKFGFNHHQEIIFKSSKIPDSNYSAIKLNLNEKSDSDIATKLLNKRRELTQLFGATEYDYITQWHLINVFPDNLIYLNEEEVIIICSERGKQLHLWDVIFIKPIDLASIIPKIIKNKDLQSILYYFPPDQLSFDYDKVVPDFDSHLFFRGKFNLEGRDFKFPITAQT